MGYLILFFGILCVVILCMAALASILSPDSGERFWLWLKGSRRIYYFGVNQRIEVSPNNLSEFMRPGIEINQGLFRRRSAIYGNAAKYWKITGGAEFSLPGFVVLENLAGLRVEKALELINKYQSLGQMLDRIAELKSRPTQLELQTAKDNLFLAENRRAEFFAAIVALLQRINVDRQHYRSKSSEDIRKCLEDVYSWAREVGECTPERAVVGTWLSRWSRQVKPQS